MAEGVIAWLGPESRDSAFAINAIRTKNPHTVCKVQVGHKEYINTYSGDRYRIQSALFSLLARPYGVGFGDPLQR